MIPRLVIGTLNQRGMLQRPVPGSTPAGGRPRTWQDVPSGSDDGKYWMSVTSVNGREEVFGMKIQATMTHVIVMRYLGGVDTTMRIVIKSVVYNIRAVNDMELRGRKLILGVERGVAT